MHSPRRPLVRASLTSAVLVVALVGGSSAQGTAGAPAGVVAATTTDEYTFTGHGWGHGRGMGQYGALGYAVNYGWGYSQILGHYYSNTTPANIGNPDISVELTSLTGSQLIAIGNNVRVNGVAVGSGLVAILARMASDGSVQLWSGAGSCAPEWVPFASYAAGTDGAETLSITTASQSGFENLIRVCELDGHRAYRGRLTVQNFRGTQMTFNRLSTEDYLRGVVPRESPDGWGNLSNGMAALKAQAVAARGYALAGSRTSRANTCDTTSCQVYRGAATVTVGGAVTVLDGSNANQAIDATAGEVRLMASGAIARTEFSSSTGGYTVAGAFPAVPDEGDAISLNPNHTWTATYTAAEVAANLGLSGVLSVAVTSRNGLGEWGGRVTQVVVVDGAGASHAYTGEVFRSAMGTSRFKSDWFVVATQGAAEAQAVVKALYQDLLGRGTDPTGLVGWTAALMSGTSQSVLVSTLTRSDEYISSRITKAYREVLGREPEAAGEQGWHVAIVAGQATVDDVQRRFYDSAEYFVASGNTAEGFVRRLYTTMLRRGASDAEVSGWVSAMAQRGRGWVVDSIWFSFEAAMVRAGDYYYTFLGRGPDPLGQQGWAQVLLLYGEGAVRAGIAGSPEYRARAITRFP